MSEWTKEKQREAKVLCTEWLEGDLQPTTSSRMAALLPFALDHIKELEKVLTEGHIEPYNEERDTEHTFATTLRHIAKAIDIGAEQGWEDWLVEKAKDIDIALESK